MSNVKVREHKFEIDGVEYTFRLDFRALDKFDERYDNAMDIFNKFLNGKRYYNCIVKILSCACVERDFTEDELSKLLSFDFPTMKKLDEIALSLMQGIVSGKEGNEEGKN